MLDEYATANNSQENLKHVDKFNKTYDFRRKNNVFVELDIEKNKTSSRVSEKNSLSKEKLPQKALTRMHSIMSRNSNQNYHNRNKSMKIPRIFLKSGHDKKGHEEDHSTEYNIADISKSKKFKIKSNNNSRSQIL